MGGFWPHVSNVLFLGTRPLQLRAGVGRGELDIKVPLDSVSRVAVKRRRSGEFLLGQLESLETQ